jgi:hypothetical protein
MAFIRYDAANAPVELFTADYYAREGAWMGVAHGITEEAASSSTNAQGVRIQYVGTRRCLHGRTNCPELGRPPRTPRAGEPFQWPTQPVHSLGISANETEGALLLQDDPTTQGLFTGHALGNPIRGGYAPSAGTLAFIRYDESGAPMQIWHAVIEAKGVGGGRAYPLSQQGGDASFYWRVRSLD